MRVNSLQRYDFTADYYDFRETDNPGVTVTREFFYDRKITCRVFTEGGTGRLTLYVAEPLRMFARINNIRDKEGTLAAGAYQNDTGWAYTITGVEPVLNALGYRDALRYALTRV